MQTIIWAFGSMLVLMLIISFLPLGYTLKGKLSILLASFVLSLGGIAAANSFSLILTALLMIALVFFTAYILDFRFGSMLYVGNKSFDEDTLVEIENENLLNSKLENVKEVHFLNLTELKMVDSNELNIVDDSKSELIQISETIESVPLVSGVSEANDEDISFLFERDTDQEDVKPGMDLESEDDYLSDIESLLAEELGENPSIEEDDHQVESGRLTLLEKEALDDQNPDELEPLDDLTLDFLIAEKQVAAGHDEVQEDLNKEK